MKNKTTAALLALFLGDLGVHRFYLNQAGLGVIYLIFCWSFIPAFIGLIDFIGFLSMDENKFNAKYNHNLSMHSINSSNTQNQSYRTSNKLEKSETGVFIIEGESIKALNKLPENGSINAISKSLGYNTTNCYTVLTHNSNIFSSIIFRRGTRNPIFAMLNNKDIEISYSDIKYAIKNIDWAFEERQLDFEDTLTGK